MNIVLAVCFFAAALLYSSVGHGGASAYLAVMNLRGVAVEVMRPIALTLNIPVALISSLRFTRAGYFRWRLFWPFAPPAIPLAVVGGRLTLPNQVIKVLLGSVLLYSAMRLALLSRLRVEQEVRRPGLLTALTWGAGLGFAAGVSGTGGGIFLSPLLLLNRWATTRETAAASAWFVFCNSVAGLAGNGGQLTHLRPAMAWYAVGAVGGGLLGSRLGSRRFAPPVLRALLAAVLLVAGLKFLGVG